MALSVSRKITRAIVGSLFALGVSLTVNVTIIISLQISDSVSAQLAGYSRLLTRQLEAEYPGDWETRNGSLSRGNFAVSGNDPVAETLAAEIGGVVAFYRGSALVAASERTDETLGAGAEAFAKVAAAVLGKGEDRLGKFTIRGTEFVGRYEPIRDATGERVGMFFVAIPHDAAAGMIRTAMEANGVNMIVVIALVALSAGAYVRRLLKPLQSVNAVAVAIGADDLSATIPADALKAKDEIGQLALAIKGMGDNLAGNIRKIECLGEGLRGTSELLNGRMDRAVASLSSISLEASAVNERVLRQNESVSATSGAMDQIAVSVGVLKDDIVIQTQSVGQSSAAIEEMIANLQSITARFGQMGEFFGKLLAASDAGRGKLTIMHGLVSGISRESTRLYEANSVISNIASQTNILAMNAAIEAAHAGDAGRGFAVVADEIRKLAEISAGQSKEIDRDVKSIAKAIETVVASSAETETAFLDIVNMIQTLNRLESEIRQAMQEQSLGSRQVIEALTRINGVTDRVRGGSAEMTDGCRSISLELRHILEISHDLRESMEAIARSTGAIEGDIREVQSISRDTERAVGSLAQEVSRYRLPA